MQLTLKNILPSKNTRMQSDTYNSTNLLNFVKSEGMSPFKFLLDKWLYTKHWKFVAISVTFLFRYRIGQLHYKIRMRYTRHKTSQGMNHYITVILGRGSELHCSHDHGTGRHGSPPSWAQSADELSAITFAIAPPVTQTNLIRYAVLRASKVYI